jgi:hypothetical protein
VWWLPRQEFVRKDLPRQVFEQYFLPRQKEWHGLEAMMSWYEEDG